MRFGMVKPLRKIGNSQGVIIEKPILELMNMGEKDSFDVEFRDGGLFLRPITMKDIYKKRSKIHRTSLNKLGE